MKKTFLAILLVLTISTVSVFALDGFTFFSGVGYDFKRVKDLNNFGSSMVVEAGTKYAIGEGFNVYADLGIRFIGSGTVEGANIKKGFFGTTIHAGLLYGMRFVNNPSIEAYVGGGLTFANTQDTSRYFNNLGVGLKCVFAYRVNNNFAVALSDHSDIYFLNSSKVCVGYGNTISAGALYKF